MSVSFIPLREVRWLVIGAMSLVLSGCVNHIKPYEQKRRQYRAARTTCGVRRSEFSQGSLFDPRGVGSRLLADARAQSVNDVVIVVIDEQATARRDAITQTTSADEQTAQMNAFLGMVTKLQRQYPDLNGANALSLASESTFAGQGQTSRSDNLQATVPSMVRQVLPNGALFIEGHRVVLVNNEEHHFYISGVIRPEDIDGLGQIQSAESQMRKSNLRVGVL